MPLRIIRSALFHSIPCHPLLNEKQKKYCVRVASSCVRYLEAMRRYRMMLTMMSDDATAKKLDDLQAAAQLELNPKHPIVRGIEVRFSSPPHGNSMK